MSRATCDLCGTALGPNSWMTVCGADCVDAYVSTGAAAPRPATGQRTLLDTWTRPVPAAAVATTLDRFAAQA